MADVLETSANHLDGEAAHVVQDHVARRLEPGGEKWLAYGARHTEASDTCPFCGQSLDDSDLAQAILTYFSAEYQDYTRSLSDKVAKLQGELDHRVFLQVRAAIASQAAVAAQWADVHPFDQASFEAGLADADNAWNQGGRGLEALLTRKQEAPLQPIKAGLAEPVLAHYVRANQTLTRLNDLLGAVEAAARAKRENEPMLTQCRPWRA